MTKDQRCYRRAVSFEASHVESVTTIGQNSAWQSDKSCVTLFSKFHIHDNTKTHQFDVRNKIL